MVYNHRILSNDYVEYEFGNGTYRQIFGPKDVEAVAAYWQKLFTDKSDGRTQYDVYEVHSIEETRKCRVSYVKTDLARKQHEEFVMHLPNEHLSNNLVMKWLRDIPPIAEYSFDIESFRLKKYPLISVTWKAKLDIKRREFIIPSVWMLKTQKRALDRFVEFCKQQAAQGQLKEAKRRKKLKNVDCNSNEIEAHAVDLLHNQNSFNIVGIASKNRNDTWNIIVRINNGTENVMVSIAMSKLQRAKLNLAHKQVLNIHEERYKQNYKA